MYCQYKEEGGYGKDAKITYFDHCLSRRIHNEKGKHYWKCFVNSDINLQYHQIMLQKKRKYLKKSQIKEPTSLLNQYPYAQMRSLSRSAGRPNQKYSTLETLRNLRLQKRNATDRQVTALQQPEHYEQERYEMVKSSIKAKQHQKKQNRKMQKIQSLKHLSKTPQNNYYSTKMIESPIRHSTNKNIKTTVCNESRESKTTFQQIESSKETQPDNQINPIFRFKTDYRDDINPNKFDESSLSDPSAHESLIPEVLTPKSEQPKTVCQQIQTKQVIILDKQTHQMQQQQRKYLRDKFMGHCEEVHKIC